MGFTNGQDLKNDKLFKHRRHFFVLAADKEFLLQITDQFIN